MDGLVVKNTGSSYVVRLEDGRRLVCVPKGKLRLKGMRTTNPIAVGDHVRVEQNLADEHSPSFIAEIKPRRNYIIRKSQNLSKESHIIGANIDLTLLVVTMTHPRTSLTFIDRFLATAEAYSVPVAILVNKVDLLTDVIEQEYLAEVVSIYENIGYPVRCISALSKMGMDDLHEMIAGKVVLLSGHSGVGKSTLINQLIPGLDLPTQAISVKHDMGIHTTTFSEMIELPDGGYLIDTPGIKGFGIIDFKTEEVSHYFPEIFQASENCRFGNCTHTHEPGCCVRQLVESGEIAPSRYNSYLSILEEEVNGKYRAPQ